MWEDIPLYIPLTLRGSEVFGNIIEAYDAIKDIRVAIKRTHKATRNLGREYQIWKKLNNCKYIVHLIDIFYSVNNDGQVIQNLVFEYYSKTLQKFINEVIAKKEYKLILFKFLTLIILKI